MPESFDRAATPDEQDGDLAELEWHRVRSFLRSPSGPLAIIEVESPEHASEVLRAITESHRPKPVHVTRVNEHEDFRQPLDWLDAHDDEDAAFVITDAPTYDQDEERTRDFWTWANAQRERWPRESGHVIFLLLPYQVDDLCNHAPMLWDWIPLKFNLLRSDSAAHRVPDTGEPYAATMHELAQAEDAPDDPAISDSLSEARLRSLREQLLRARQKGLPEHLVRRDFAWPLLRALVHEKRLDEARHVLENELGYEFPTELPTFQFFEANELLEGFLATLDLERAGHARRALSFHKRQGGALLRQLQGFMRECTFTLLALTTASCGDFEACGDWAARWAEHCERVGHDTNLARAHKMLGYVAQQRGDLDRAEAHFMRAFNTFEKMGDGEEASELLAELTAVEHERASARDATFAPERRATKDNGSLVMRVARPFLVRGARFVERVARKRWLSGRSRRAWH